MSRSIATRLARLLVVFLIVTLGTTLLVDLSPGDPALVVAGETASDEVVEAVRQRYGFDQPVLSRWADWTTSLFRGDFGVSYRNRTEVSTLIGDRLPVTIQLTLTAIAMAVTLGVPLGLYAAYHRGSLVDRVISSIASALIALPSFVIALTLVLFLALGTGWFPTSNWVYLSEGVGPSLRATFLPALSLALIEISILVPVLRADAVSTLEDDYVSLARAKGISTPRLLFRHVLRPSSISIVTLLGLSLARLFGGAIVIEYVFNLPGLGSLLIQSIRFKDLMLMQGLVAFIALVYVLSNLLVDLVLARLDPRTAA